MDGTLTAAPRALGALGAALVAAGHRVTVLTGALPSFPALTRTAEGRVAQLASFALEQGTHFSAVEVCKGTSPHEVALLKRQFCAEHDVVLLIDDDPDYCNAVAEVTNVAQFRFRPSGKD